MGRYTVTKTDEQWQQQLTPKQYAVTRKSATEEPFTGRYWNAFEDGQYQCVCCGALLFSSQSKFDAGCGWPSYTAPVDENRLEHHIDHSHNMVRTEVVCSHCGAHLGHVFEDGPAPDGLRYCINSAALRFEASSK